MCDQTLPVLVNQSVSASNNTVTFNNGAAGTVTAATATALIDLASVLLDEQLSSETLSARIEALIDHRERLEAMAERARAFGRPDASDRLADLVEEASRR